jgi:mitogen-activated protein kinase organizer 1
MKAQSARVPIQILMDAQDSVSEVCANGPFIITSSVDGHVRQYDIRKGQILTDSFAGVPVLSVKYNEDRMCYLAASLDSTLRLINSSSGTVLNSYIGHKNVEYQIRPAFCSNEGIIIGGSELNGELLAWDVMTSRIVYRLPSLHKKCITSVNVYSGGGAGAGVGKRSPRVLACSADGTSTILTASFITR